LLTRSISSKLSRVQYELLAQRAQKEGISVSECARRLLLLAESDTNCPSRSQQARAEIRALRAIVLNLLFALVNGERMTAAQMQFVIDRADEQARKDAI
jgi:hypothetical protein